MYTYRKNAVLRKDGFVSRVKDIYGQAESFHYTADILRERYAEAIYDHPHYARLTIAEKEYIRGYRDALDNALWRGLEWRLGPIDGPLPVNVDGWKVPACCQTALKLRALKCPICSHDLVSGSGSLLGDLSRVPGALFGGHYWKGTEYAFTAYACINRPTCQNPGCYHKDVDHNPETGECRDPLGCRVQCQQFDAGYQMIGPQNETVTVG